MLSVREIQQFLSYAPPEQADIVFELRNLIFEVAPDATEVIRTRTRTLSYYFSANQGDQSAPAFAGSALRMIMCCSTFRMAHSSPTHKDC
jgi:hypothetical protein